MLPFDFDILSFSNSSHPWAKIFFGRGRSAAHRNAGQKMAWKRTISLPIRCRSAGQSSRTHRASIRVQRVEPDVKDVRCFIRNRNAPLDRGAADRNILETLLDERNDFVFLRLPAE